MIEILNNIILIKIMAEYIIYRGKLIENNKPLYGTN